MSMKKTIFCILAGLCAALLLFGATGQPNGDLDPLEIIISEGGSNSGGSGYHAPALIPISAEYYPSLCSILLDFRYDLGYVTVLLENQSTGATSQTVINAVQGSQLFPISGDFGVYEITFTLTNGRVYVGTFEIE